MSGPDKAYARRRPSSWTALWGRRRPALTWLDIELTERCNFNCMHCNINRPAGDAAARAREWDARQWMDLLDQAAALGCLTVRLTGGEPLLRDDFREIYVHARRLGLRVMLFTNASLLTPADVDLFRRVPPLERIEISVYGTAAADGDACARTPGSWDAARRGVSLLVDARIPFVVKGASLPPNKGEGEAFATWARSVTDTGRPPAVAALFDLRTRRDDPAKDELIRKLRPTPAEAARLLTEGDEARRELVRFVAARPDVPGDRLFLCDSRVGKGAVDPYGRFQYCLTLRHPETVFDLGLNPLRAAVLDFLPGLNERRAADPRYLARCARCPLKSICQQCPAKAWTEHGTLDTPVEFYCDVAHAQAARLGLIRPGEKAWETRDWASRIGILTE